MITTGVVGQQWRASVTVYGALQPWDGSPTVDWFVAADDRWHDPSREAAVRQTAIDGTPVIETRLRVPGGDAVQRIYSVATGGGCTVIELTNDSPMPIAVAVTRPDLVGARPPTSTPIEGIEVPPGTQLHPIGHRSTVRLLVPHAGYSGHPSEVPDAADVVRGWLTQTQRASRLVLPDEGWTHAVTAARCELLLAGLPAGGAGFVLGAAELVRLGMPPAPFVDELAAELPRLARQAGGADRRVAVAASRVFHAAHEHRAVVDVGALPLVDAALGPRLPDEPAFVAQWVEAWLVDGCGAVAELFPLGLPAGWLGADFEAHGVAIGTESTLSMAVRWHGDRPALLWEVDGPPMPLQYGTWHAAQPRGEALLPAPGHP